MERSNFLTVFGTLCLVWVSFSAQAQDLDLINDWDADNDGILNDDEFGSMYTNSSIYDDWDINNDDILDEDEFGDGLFDTWDANDDGIIDNDEYGYGLYDEFGDDYTDFSTWDADGNNEINENEFDEVYSSSSIYDDWDADGNNEILNDEVDEGIFSWLDDNDDDYLDTDEVGVADDLFSDYM